MATRGAIIRWLIWRDLCVLSNRVTNHYLVQTTVTSCRSIFTTRFCDKGKLGGLFYQTIKINHIQIRQKNRCTISHLTLALAKRIMVTRLFWDFKRCRNILALVYPIYFIYTISAWPWIKMFISTSARISFCKAQNKESSHKQVDV